MSREAGGSEPPGAGVMGNGQPADMGAGQIMSFPKLGNGKEKNEVAPFSQGRSDMKTPQDTQKLIGS